LGAGVFLIYSSFWPRDDVPIVSGRRGGVMLQLGDHLQQAGYASVWPGNVVVGSVLLFLVAYVLLLALTGVVPIALCFAVMAGAVPASLVRMRARSRRRKLRDLWPD